MLPPISGKLSKPGFTVIALGANGQAKSVVAKHGKFKLRPPAKKMTLQLRTPDGVYGGPIAVGTRQKGKQALLGVKAGAKLGQIKLKAGKGYATLKNGLAKKWLDMTRGARAKNGVPIGNGRNVGLVRSRYAHGPADDPDLDGVPSSLDVDDDGDLILDGYDRSIYRSASKSASKSSPIGATFPGGGHLGVITNLRQSLEGPTNVDGGSSSEQIAAFDREEGLLNISWIGLDPDPAELDCGALVYCSLNGTGRLSSGESSTRETAVPFPECCDPDKDGLGSFTSTRASGGFMDIFHGATAAQIRAGDVLIERGTIHGAPQESATTVGFISATLPVLATYDDRRGDSATLSYPRPAVPLPVRAGPGGDVVLSLKFWRPQRPRIAGEPGTGEWMDVGNLVYATAVATLPPKPEASGTCPQSSYSTMDSNLTPLPPSPFASGPPTNGQVRFFDASGDQPSDPANTFTYTLNVTECLASKGAFIAPAGSFTLQFWSFAVRDNGAGGEETVSMMSSAVNFSLQP